ncbi:hypothetical protein [Xanthomonas melonis]|uniref:hypothetical protein n=1 Tax=Xanthomonas melonis TaxID=56456 RepID=UPI001E3A141F|nr:hypothetical protein [Xanthomonas melonis]MCD0246831.1 hypothetical protein [Xanthomonas melonis]
MGGIGNELTGSLARQACAAGQSTASARRGPGQDPAERDAGSSSARQPAYYTDEQVEVPLSTLQSLHAGNELRHAYR